MNHDLHVALQAMQCSKNNASMYFFFFFLHTIFYSVIFPNSCVSSHTCVSLTQSLQE